MGYTFLAQHTHSSMFEDFLTPSLADGALSREFGTRSEELSGNVFRRVSITDLVTVFLLNTHGVLLTPLLSTTAVSFVLVVVSDDLSVPAEDQFKHS
eukprot:m.230964 g.230964  ORF g.230964 m.230964 type:complete len:97 (-) comp19263_c1_seq1:1216-1506(-)